jgi:HK97 gp10 family phage protein
LKILGKRITEAVIAELDDGADVIVARQKAAAPKLSGKLESTIRRSKVRQGKKSATVTIRAGGRATTKEGSGTRPGGVDYAVEQEFGNKNMPAQPFFYPPIRQNEDDIRRKVRRAFRREVKDF